MDFFRRVRLKFRVAQLSSDGGLIVVRELGGTPGRSASFSRRCVTATRGRRPSTGSTHSSGNRTAGDRRALSTSTMQKVSLLIRSCTRTAMDRPFS